LHSSASFFVAGLSLAKPDEMIGPSFLGWIDQRSSSLGRNNNVLRSSNIGSSRSCCLPNSTIASNKRYERTATIGFKLNWEELLAEKGMRINGHSLIRTESESRTKEIGDRPYPCEQLLARAARNREAEKEKIVVERHKTALTRYELSKPVKTLLEYGLLKPGMTFFDYGCGQGSDFRGLQALGHDAEGWDPVHRPAVAKREADVVNMGYAVNSLLTPSLSSVGEERENSILIHPQGCARFHVACPGQFSFRPYWASVCFIRSGTASTRRRRGRCE
jgi:hypothetical protein